MQKKKARTFVDIFFFVLRGHIFIITIFPYSHPFLKHRGEEHRLWCQNQNKMCGHLQGGGCLPSRHGSTLFCHLFLLCLRPHLSLPLREQPFPCVQLYWELVSAAFYKSQGIQTIPFLPQHSQGDIPWFRLSRSDTLFWKVNLKEYIEKCSPFLLQNLPQFSVPSLQYSLSPFLLFHLILQVPADMVASRAF